MNPRLFIFGIVCFLMQFSLHAQKRRKAESLPQQFVTSSADNRFFAVNYFIKRFEAGGFNHYQMIRVYHVRSRRYLSNIKLITEGAPKQMRFSPDGKKLLLQTGQEFLLFDIRLRKKIQKIPNTYCIDFIKGGEQLVVQENNQIKSYHTEDASSSTTYKDLPNSLRLDSLLESPNQQWLIGLGKGQCFLWKQGHSALQMTFPASSLVFTPNGKECIVLSYRNRRCYITAYDTHSFRQLRETSCEIYRDLERFVLTSGNSISPDGQYMAFCAKRNGETKSIGVYNQATNQLILDIDSVGLGNRKIAVLEQPYSWQVESGGILVLLENEQKAFVPFNQEAVATYQTSGRFKISAPSPSGQYIASFNSKRSRNTMVQSSLGGKEELLDGTFLSYSPNSEFLFLSKDSLYGLVKTSDIGSSQVPFFPFSTQPYVPGSEDMIAEDAIAPIGYTHRYLSQSRPLSELPPNTPLYLEHKSVITDGDTVGIQMHILDDQGNYYSIDSADSLVWCEMEIERGDSVYTLPPSQWTRQAISTTDTMPLAMALVMDHSGSMGEERAQIVQLAVDSLIRSKQPRDTVALIKYDSQVGIESPLCAAKDSLIRRLQRNGLGNYGGGTAILDAVSEAIRILRPADNYTEKVVLIFTDGEENSSVLTTGELLTQARREGVKVYTIGFGASVDTTFLQRMSRLTGGSYYQIYSTSDFQRIFHDAYRRMRSYYQINIPVDTVGRYTFRLKLCLPNGSQTLVTRYQHRKAHQNNFLEDISTITLLEEERLQKDSLFSGFDTPPKAGELKLLPVQFYFDQTTLISGSESAIDSAVSYLQKYPRISIELRGHTDNVGNDAYNLYLSEKRAEKIRELLIAKGIHPQRLQAKGYGEDKPIASNSTKEGRARNRRTELLILSN